MRTSAKKPAKSTNSKLGARYLNHRAFWRLKSYIDKTYPPGHYIGIVDGKIVADAEDFETIHEKLKSLETCLDHSMVVQAGVKYYKKAIDLL
ncbi:MAG: hypothetical protein ONB44_22875 [candidate division KSB1 bacterium]|nr:hypothetical protein [candidate division KSB1 bacterium]MDZ7304983.1 hypothetical protein [candidate division KSB1 bacterium]MDZ7314026.1 hypothetical protein [candidate division KSB1 bacterium]